jgi:hypothetical protein
MLKLADLVDQNVKELAELDTICMGGTLGINSGFFTPEAAAVFRCEFLLGAIGELLWLLILGRLCWMGRQD